MLWITYAKKVPIFSAFGKNVLRYRVNIIFLIALLSVQTILSGSIEYSAKKKPAY